MNIISIDGPGQGNSNIQKIRAVGDNYERAGAGGDRLPPRREEVEPSQIGSTASAWAASGPFAFRATTTGWPPSRARWPASTRTTPSSPESSPRFKQVFMYMAGMDDEDEFDEMAKTMTVKGYMDKIQCPILLITGEFDPLCPWRTPSRCIMTSRARRRCGCSRTSSTPSGSSRTLATWTATSTRWTG